MQNFPQINFAEVVGELLEQYQTPYAVGVAMERLNPAVGGRNYGSAIKRLHSGEVKEPGFTAGVTLLLLAGRQVEITRRGGDSTASPQRTGSAGGDEISRRWDGDAMRRLRESCSVDGWWNLSGGEFAALIAEKGGRDSYRATSVWQIESGIAPVPQWVSAALDQIQADVDSGKIPRSTRVRSSLHKVSEPTNLVQQVLQATGMSMESLGGKMNPPITRAAISAMARSGKIPKRHIAVLQSLLTESA